MPPGTNAFVLMLSDHVDTLMWAVVNIPGTVRSLPEGIPNGNSSAKLPAGALQTRTDFGAPCPPQGDHPHRYLFTVFAVKIDKLV